MCGIFTSFCRVDGHHLAEGAISLVVVDPNLHLKGSQRREGLVPVLEGGGVGRGHHLFLPTSCPVGPECHDVSEALPVLELLRHRLKGRVGSLWLDFLKTKERLHTAVSSTPQATRFNPIRTVNMKDEGGGGETSCLTGFLASNQTLHGYQ